jgi:hypothetical protein
MIIRFIFIRMTIKFINFTFFYHYSDLFLTLTLQTSFPKLDTLMTLLFKYSFFELTLYNPQESLSWFGTKSQHLQEELRNILLTTIKWT